MEYACSVITSPSVVLVYDFQHFVHFFYAQENSVVNW